MSQIFATDFGWSQSYPMTRKGEAHEALGLIFAREGVPPKMIVDDAKEMTGRVCSEMQGGTLLLAEHGALFSMVKLR